MILSGWLTRTGAKKPAIGVMAAMVLGAAAGCLSRPTDQQVRQQAAQTTVAVKQGAKEAAAATRVAAADAARDLKDVAAGVKQGLHEDSKGHAKRIDLNSASQLRLATLPGISFSKAGDIVDGRPYSSSRQLVARGLLTGEQFAKIAPQVTVVKP